MSDKTNHTHQAYAFRSWSCCQLTDRIPLHDVRSNPISIPQERICQLAEGAAAGGLPMVSLRPIRHIG